ncbi:MAG: hypothetical protein HZB26_06300 [Candidatus Hydrogenedentes bacterium]|nr:hypothetical protein [Candidatus Hydrogenedentota bacterium]
MKQLFCVSSSFRLALCATMIAALAGCASLSGQTATRNTIMRAPAGERYVELNPDGTTVLPNGRLITPAGKSYRIHPHPYGMTLSPDGRWLVTANSGHPICISILDLAQQPDPAIYQIPEKLDKREGVLEAVYMGLAIDAKNEVVYAAGGRDWSVMAFDLKTRQRIFRLGCEHTADGVTYEHGYVSDMRLSPDGTTLYAMDQSNFRMLIIDVAGRKVLRSIPVGRYPFGLALSTDGRRAFVANVGMFEYSLIRDTAGKEGKMDFPPFGVPSKEAEEGVTVDGLVAKGLGSMNDINGMSVFTVDISERGKEHVIEKTKTGHLVGEKLEDFPAVGGSSPNSLVVTEKYVYVSNGSNDSLTVIDAKTGKRVRDINLSLGAPFDRLRGMIPFGLALAPNHQTLYVAEAGINAVGVVRLTDHKVLGHIPTAWFPSRLAVSPDGKTLYVANAKGMGAGPSTGPGHKEGDPTGVGDLMRGYVSIIPIPGSQNELAAMTEKVRNNNVTLAALNTDSRPEGFPVPAAPRQWKSPIKHIIYVTKENRTYDEVFGALPNGRGDGQVCRLGRPVTVFSKDNSRKVEGVTVMPNHITLAKRFAIGDNFYCDSDHSVDGHRWLVDTYPNEFMEAKIGEDTKGNGPGKFAFIGSSGAIYPEDYNEAGSMWEHFERGHVTFRNYGLGFEFWPGDEEQSYRYTGIKLPVNYPMPKVLFDNTSRKFATFNMAVPDQFRIDQFEIEFKERWLSGKEPLPQLITMMLPNDHGSGERPADGYPFWASYMSDNDLALGRLVEMISHSPFWKDTAIFVTEDDAQGFVDTVDAHRSVCMVISPYAKKNHISHTHSSIASIIKTMFLVLGLAPLNQYDGFASDLSDMFTEKPDNAAPYNALPVNKEIFDPQKALTPFDANFNWKALAESPVIDDEQYLENDEYGFHAELNPNEIRAK